MGVVLQQSLGYGKVSYLLKKIVLDRKSCSLN